MLVVAIPLVLLIPAAILLVYRRAEPAPGEPPACAYCRYDLSGTVGRTGQCPECGSPIEEVPHPRPSKGLLVIAYALIALALACAFLMFVTTRVLPD